MKKIRQTFSQAVTDYLKAIGEDFNSREGDDSTRGPFREKIINQYKEIPAPEKVNHLLFLFRTMSEPTGDSALTGWRRDIAFDLVTKLYKE
jgi:hypothetical protein